MTEFRICSRCGAKKDGTCRCLGEYDGVTRCFICGGLLDSAGQCVNKNNADHMPELPDNPFATSSTFDLPGAPGTCGKCGAPWFYAEGSFGPPTPTCVCWNLPKMITSTDVVLDGKSGEYGVCEVFDTDEGPKAPMEAARIWKARALEAEGRLKAVKNEIKHAVRNPKGMTGLEIRVADILTGDISDD